MGKLGSMDELRTFLKSLSVSEQDDFARRVGTSLGYLRKVMSTNFDKLGESLVIAIERESGGAVRCESLRPDVDWGYLRSSARPPKINRKAG